MEFIYDLFSKLLQMPVLAAESGRGIDRLIILIHLLMLVLFVGWFSYFLFTLWRFRGVFRGAVLLRLIVFLGLATPVRTLFRFLRFVATTI